MDVIKIKGASEHNLKNISLEIPRNKITVITGVSGSGKSSLAFDTILAESQRRFFYTLSNYSRQYLDMGSRPKVSYISGLSPSIALSQNETPPSRKATIATLTDIGELIGVLLSRFGDKLCPKHGLKTEGTSKDSLFKNIQEKFSGKTVGVFSPIVEKKKGHFQEVFTKLEEKGYSRVFIDGELLPLYPTPKLAKEEKHTLKLVIDILKISEANQVRLERSMDNALKENKEAFEICEVDQKFHVLEKTREIFSMQSGCEKCGFSWGKIDARFFSSNSLGQCEKCTGFGVVGLDAYEESHVFTEEESFLADDVFPCDACRGIGIAEKINSIRLHDQSIFDLYSKTISDVIPYFLDVREKFKTNKAVDRLCEEIIFALTQIKKMGLGYLNLSRRIRTLSGGEYQRVKLSNVLSEQLRGILYVLDEPSQGLHPSEVDNLFSSILDLKKSGNTILIVDHDEDLMRKSDLIIDLGPGGGRDGGNISAIFEPAEAKKYADKSITAYYLSKKNEPCIREKKTITTPCIEVNEASLNNLKIPSVKGAL